MKIVYPEMQLEIEMMENQVQVISVENSESFASILNELWNQTSGNDGSFILSDMEKELNFTKDVELIINPFSLDPNNKKVLTSAYHQLDEIVNEDLQEETTNIRASLVSFLDILIQRIPYPLDYDENTNIGGLYKMFGIKIDTCATTLAESIIDYLKAMSEICGISVFIFVNLKDYLSIENLKYVYEFAFNEKIHLINIEAKHIPSIEGEKSWIIDNDRCIIEP